MLSGSSALGPVLVFDWASALGSVFTSLRPYLAGPPRWARFSPVSGMEAPEYGKTEVLNRLDLFRGATSSAGQNKSNLAKQMYVFHKGRGEVEFR